MNTTPSRLRELRHKLGLSQEDLSHLLGGMTRGMVYRHEAGNRMPDLETALGYAFVLGEEIPQIYPELVSQVQDQIQERIRELHSDLQRESSTIKKDRKIEILENILSAK